MTTASTWRRLLDVLESDVGTIRSRIDNAENFRQKLPIIGGLLLKAIVTLIFCATFVLAFVLLLGQENAIVGVVVLLAVMTFQKVHFGYQQSHAAASMLVIFLIYAFIPPLASHAAPVVGALLIAASLGVILWLGCDQVAFQNHIVLVLSFLLLYGYPVSPEGYWQRVVGLLIGGVWAASILYRKNKHHSLDRTLGDVIRDAVRWSPENEWRLKLMITVPLAILCGQLLGLDRPMWIGIAAMSVLSPDTDVRPRKMVERFVGTVIGTVIFFVVISLVPIPGPILGMIGGFLVGLTTSYRYQTIFNSLGALSVALALFGPVGSATARIADNAFGIVATFVMVFLIDRLISWSHTLRSTRDTSQGTA